MLLARFLFVFCTLTLLVFPDRAVHGSKLDQPQRDPLREGGRSHDKDHIQEHLRDLTNVSIEDMSSEELQFHYFKLHDYDNNNMLDGLELVAALTHFEDSNSHQDDEAQDDNQEKEEDIANTYSDEDIISMVDQVLDQEDANKDGLVSYAEFRQAQDGEAHSKQTSDNAGQM
jgi:hypothetical protein